LTPSTASAANHQPNACGEQPYPDDKASSGAAFQSSTPQFLLNATPPHLRTPSFECGVSADGERFLMIEPMENPNTSHRRLSATGDPGSARLAKQM
jgi:hypothetical protein